MTFSEPFLSTIIYGSLIWCGIAALALAGLLIRDLLSGKTW